MSPDPIGFNGGDENLYRYVGNNPVYYSDPSGLATYMCNSWEETYPYDYLWIDGGINGGLTPADEISKFTAFYGSTPGGDQGGPPPGSEGTSCEKVPSKNKSQEQCIDKCVRDILDSPRPNYSIRGKGMACKEYVRRTVSGCLAVCAQ